MRPADTGFSFKPPKSGILKDQQGYFQEFRFKEGTDKLNLILLDNLDVERLYYTGNIGEAQVALRNLTQSKISNLDIETMTYEQYYKLFRLSQLAMEHFTQQQSNKQQQSEILYNQFNVQKEKCQKMEKLREQHEQKKKSLQQQLDALKEKIDSIKEQTLAIGQYKCIYCNKTFKERDMLTSHVKRRHQEQLQEIKAQKEMISEENPVMKIKRMEEERKQMQEIVHLKQMQQLQRIHEREINEQKIIDELGEKMDINFEKTFKQAQKEDPYINKKLQEQDKENEQNKQVIENMNEMKQMFQQIDSQFTDLKKKQDNIQSLQKDQQKQFGYISKQQEQFIQESLKDKEKLAQQRKETDKTFEQIKERDTNLMVSHYVNNLSDSVCSQEFQENIKKSQQKHKEDRQEELRKKLIPMQRIQGINKDDPSNLIQIGELMSDRNSEPEEVFDIDAQKRRQFKNHQDNIQKKEQENIQFKEQYEKNLYGGADSQKQYKDTEWGKQEQQKNEEEKQEKEKQKKEKQEKENQEEDDKPILIKKNSRIGRSLQQQKKNSQDSIQKQSQEDLEKKSQKSENSKKSETSKKSSILPTSQKDILPKKVFKEDSNSNNNIEETKKSEKSQNEEKNEEKDFKQLLEGKKSSSENIKDQEPNKINSDNKFDTSINNKNDNKDNKQDIKNIEDIDEDISYGDDFEKISNVSGTSSQVRKKLAKEAMDSIGQSGIEQSYEDSNDIMNIINKNK